MASVVENKNTSKKSRQPGQEPKPNDALQKIEPTEKLSSELHKASKTIQKQDTTIAELRLQLKEATRQNAALTQQVELLKMFYDRAGKIDTAAERLIMAVKDKSGSDEILREELEIWCDNIADVMAERICCVMEGAFEEFKKEVDEQLGMQKESIKKIGDQTIRCGWKEIVFWTGLGLMIVSAVLSIFLLLDVHYFRLPDLFGIP